MVVFSHNDWSARRMARESFVNKCTVTVTTLLSSQCELFLSGKLSYSPSCLCITIVVAIFMPLYYRKILSICVAKCLQIPFFAVYIAHKNMYQYRVQTASKCAESLRNLWSRETAWLRHTCAIHAFSTRLPERVECGRGGEPHVSGRWVACVTVMLSLWWKGNRS